MATGLPNPQPNPLGMALGQGMADQALGSHLQKQFGHFLSGMGGQGLTAAPAPPNIDALRKISDPRIMQMAASMLMQQQYKRQQFGSPYLTPEENRQSALVKGGLKAPATSGMAQRKENAVQALEKKLASGKATAADRRKYDKAIGITPEDSLEDKMLKYVRIAEQGERVSSRLGPNGKMEMYTQAPGAAKYAREEMDKLTKKPGFDNTKRIKMKDPKTGEVYNILPSQVPNAINGDNTDNLKLVLADPNGPS